MPNRTNGHRSWPAVLLLALAGCEGHSLPTVPDTTAAGVIVYEHANYQGQSALLTSSVDDLRKLDGPCTHSSSSQYGGDYYDWSDCISSIRVLGGWTAMVFDGAGFSGERLHVTADVPNLQLVAGSCNHDGLNDCITSIRVDRP